MLTQAVSERLTMPPKSYLIDMDGVIVAGATVIPGAVDFFRRLQERERRFLVLTNNPTRTPADLSYHFSTLGIDVPASTFYTSAMATAQFLDRQRPRGPRSLSAKAVSPPPCTRSATS